MAKSTTAKPAPEAKPKRKMLTPSERVAKLEADLEAARKKAEQKNEAVADKLKTKRSTVVQRIEAEQAKLAKIDAELTALGYEVVEFVADVTPDDQPTEDTES